MKKLWDKGIEVNKPVEKFTVGRDREFDLQLARFDILGNLAHARMIASIGLLTQSELKTLTKELIHIYKETEKGHFIIEDGVEDVHSQIELMLTRKLGEAGKKIHSGRSRNDQVLVDMKLYLRAKLQDVTLETEKLFSLLQQLSNKHREVLMPGYTHFQVAMPSSFGLWFGAYAECLVEDMQMLLAAYRIADQNPLGSAAGYGSSFPLKRQMTTDLLGFSVLNYNVINAQLGRGRSERASAVALASVGSTLAKMSMDVCLYMSQNYGFVSFPDELTTGSSIMPHKKNPDVFELIRSKGNRLQALPTEISMITGNLPAGYHRDLQIIKEIIMPAFDDLIDCLQMAQLMFHHIKINKKAGADAKYIYMFSVEEVNKLVLKGISFRDAYRQVAEDIKEGSFKPDYKIHHTHEGSIGNLCNDKIKSKFNKVKKEFGFTKAEKAFEKLLLPIK